MLQPPGHSPQRPTRDKRIKPVSVTLHTVHDDTWKPLKSGDSVVVTQGLFGRIVEYRTRNAYRPMACTAIMGPVFVLALWIMRKKGAG